MSEAEDTLKNFEWYDVLPGNQFFDQLDRRFFINFTEHPIKIGFGHNTRRVEMIAIIDGVTKDPKLEALEGKEVTEE